MNELTKSEDPLGLARVSVDANGRSKLGLDYPAYGTDLCKLPMPWIAGQAISLTGFQAVGFMHMRMDDVGFTFSGIEKGSTIAVSTLGTRKNPEVFINGFRSPANAFTQMCVTGSNECRVRIQSRSC